MNSFEVLFEKYTNNTISKSEFDEMWLILNSDEKFIDLPHQLQLHWSNNNAPITTNEEWILKLNQLRNKSKQSILLKNKKWLYAAVIVSIISISLVYLLIKNNSKLNVNVNHIATSNHDIIPGTIGSIINLENGKTIVIDTAKNGNIYNALYKNNETIIINENFGSNLTVTTPRARYQQIQLSDSTKVWLNAASTLKIHEGFLQRERVVELTGEAYFEVVKNSTKPFVVKVKDASIKVFGTKFNVLAYTNDANIKTTLIEGAVTFTHNKQSINLQPKQQSQLLPNGKIKLLSNVPIEVNIDWTKGLHTFKDAALPEIMNEIERWYDIEVKYEGVLPHRLFNGEIPRSANLSELLKLFEINNIRFKMDYSNKKIIFTP